RRDRAAREVEVREVAAAAEAALRPVVARDPLLVVPLARIGGSFDRAAPADPVGGAVDEDPQPEVAATSLRLGKRRGEPDPVAGVVGDDRVADRVDARLLRQEPGAPRRAGVPRGREADPGRAAAEVPSALEDGDDRRPEGGARGLDLGLVLRGLVGERVARELPADDLAVVRYAVGQLGGHEVVAGAAGDLVDGLVRLSGDPIVTRAAVEDVAAAATSKDVVAA